MAHLSETNSRKGVLSRNCTYRIDARNKLDSKGIYDNAAFILNGIQKRDAATGQSALVGGLTQAARVPTYYLNYFNANSKANNFGISFIPYLNQAHHIVPCEIFYNKKWTAKHLKIVMQSGYDINNEDNIIMLPQCYGADYRKDYHNLPDHSKGHQTYNDRILRSANKIYDLVNKAVKEKDCNKKKDIRKQVYDALKNIETQNYNKIIGYGNTQLS